MDANRLIRIVRYNWIYLAIGILLGGVLGGAYATLAEPEYTARADVFVAVTGSSTTGDLAQGSNFSQQQARNFSAVATREIVLQPVIDELDLDVTTAQLRPHVKASVQLNTSVISIYATDASPTRAANIANLVAQNLAAVVPTLSPQVDGASPVRLRVVESATAPTQPSAPNTTLLVTLGLLGGAVAGCAAVAVRQLIGMRIVSADQVRETTHLETIGSIGFDRNASRQPLAMLSDPHSLRAEDYRQLRANLRFIQSERAHRSFVVTSTMTGEGKSSTAANTAIALAASGLSVCLVEADLRRPSLARLLDLVPGPGLTNVIANELTLDEAILPYGTEKFDVLLSGDIPPNPSELLEGSAMLALLEELQHRYDVTIIDSPPVSPVADAAVLGRLAGGVLFVVAAGRVRERDLRRSVERLKSVEAPVEGVVLNMVRVTRGMRSRYAGYSVTTTSSASGLHESSVDGAPRGTSTKSFDTGATVQAELPKRTRG